MEHIKTAMDAVNATGMLQRFTIRFSYQPDRKLGFVLVDDDPLGDFDGDFDWVDSDDDGCLFIRGGGGPSLLQSAPARQSPQKSERGTSPTSSGVKRNRPTNVRISGSSYAFTFANKLRDAAEKFVSESHELANEKSAPQLMEGNLDELVEWGRTNLPPTMLSNGDPFCLDDVNEASIKYAVTGAIKPGDTVEKVEFSVVPTSSTAAASSTSHSKGLRKRKKSTPYFRSDHFKTVYLENKHNSCAELKKILSVELHYPLYITLKRWVRPDDANNSQKCDHFSSKTHSQSDGCGPPVQKRMKRSDSHDLSTADHPSSINADEKKAQQSVGEEGVICLLDSSDEEEMDDKGPLIETNPHATNITQKQSDGCPKYSSSMHINADNPPPRPISPLRRQAVPPDPSLLPLHDDEFVLTPYGPGKILSWRVERHAFSKLSFDSSLDKDAAASIFEPIIIYSIDLHFGTCHIPADQVKSISGTHYTEKTVLTYHRVPITEMDLLRLRPLTYLNDSIVNFYLKYLKVQRERENEKNVVLSVEDSERDHVHWDDFNGEGFHIFPSFCYTRIVNILESGPGGNRNSRAIRKRLWTDLKSWTKGVDIFRKKFLIFPINEHLHWTCVLVCHPDRLLRRYAKATEACSLTTKTIIETPKASPCVMGSISLKSNMYEKGDSNAISVQPASLLPHSQGPTNTRNSPSERETSTPGEGLRVDGNSSGGDKKIHTKSEVAAHSFLCVEKPGIGRLGSSENNTMHVGVTSLRFKVNPCNKSTLPLVPIHAVRPCSSTSQPANSNKISSPTHVENNNPTVATGIDVNNYSIVTSNDCNYDNVMTTEGTIELNTIENTAKVDSAVEITPRHCPAIAETAVHPQQISLPSLEGDAATDSVIKECVNDLTAPESSISFCKQGDRHKNSHQTSCTEGILKADLLCSPNDGIAHDTVFVFENEKRHNSIAQRPPNILGDNKLALEENFRSPSTRNEKLIETETTQSDSPAEKANVKKINKQISNQLDVDRIVPQVMPSKHSTTSFSKSKILWRCDFCEKSYPNFEEAEAHEKVCENNIDWCMIHFDSGKHFKLHKPTQIFSNIRKYLNAYYESEHASHCSLINITQTNMPGFGVPVPVQDNTKDCGVYMLQIIEGLMLNPPKVDKDFVKKRGLDKKNSFGKNMFDNEAIEKKRHDILQLVKSLQSEQGKSNLN